MKYRKYVWRCETGYRARNSNTYVVDAITQSSADFATEYGCALISTEYLDQDRSSQTKYELVKLRLVKLGQDWDS